MQRLCIFHLLSLIVVGGVDEVLWDKEYITTTIEAEGKCDRKFNLYIKKKLSEIRK